MKWKILGFLYAIGRPIKKLLPSKLRYKINNMLLGDHPEYTPVSLPLPQKYERGAYPDGVNLYGFFEARIGLAEGARLYANALQTQEIPHAFVNIDFMDWLNLSSSEKLISGALSEGPRYNINVWHLNAGEYIEAIRRVPNEYYDKHYNIGVWLWELEDLPEIWCHGFDYLDEVWVPSSFIQSAIQKSTDLPVTVVPYGICASADHSMTRADFGLPEEDFLVLCMYDTHSYIGRKNPQAAITAFFEAFGRTSPGIKLVLKMNNPDQGDLDTLRDYIGTCDNVIFFTEDLEKPAVNAFISCCDVYISLHRSEGFGLVMAEAMYLGVPVVATNWSANTDFMNSDVACMVDCGFVSVGDEYQGGEEIKKARWADPNPHQAAEYLELLYRDKSAYQRYAIAGQHYIRTAFSPEASGERMSLRIQEIFNEQN